MRGLDILSMPWYKGRHNADLQHLVMATTSKKAEDMMESLEPRSLEEMMHPGGGKTIPQNELCNRSTYQVLQTPPINASMPKIRLDSTLHAGIGSRTSDSATKRHNCREPWLSEPAAEAAWLISNSLSINETSTTRNSTKEENFSDSKLRCHEQQVIGQELHRGDGNSASKEPHHLPTTSIMSTLDSLLNDPLTSSSSHSTARARAKPVKISFHQATRWKDRFTELLAFKEKHEHCNVPSYWPENRPLAQWVKHQRYQHKMHLEGERSAMTNDRIKLLTSIGFVWDSHSQLWEERLEELRNFRLERGHGNVPSKYSSNPQLAIWCKCQRRQFKIFCEGGPSASNLTWSRICKLADADFVFDHRESKRSEKEIGRPLSSYELVVRLMPAEYHHQLFQEIDKRKS